MRAAVSRDELEVIVREAHHLRDEHRRAHPGGARRRFRAALLESEHDFERLLGEWVTDAATRAAWRAHFYADGPEPAEPAPALPLVFRGRSDSGSVVEVRERPGGEYAIEVDGALVERIQAELDFSSTHAPHTFALDSIVFQETFSVSRDALAALDEYVAGKSPRPPWWYTGELVGDGLVDRYLGSPHAAAERLRSGSERANRGRDAAGDGRATPVARDVARRAPSTPPAVTIARESAASFLCNGVGGGLASPARRATDPSSVAGPVAVTTSRAPIAAEATAAARSSATNGSRTCRKAIAPYRGPPSGSMRFGPAASSRAAASPVARPASQSLPSLRTTRSASSA